MRAEVIQAFVGKPDGAVYGRPVAVGDVIEGELAEVAVRDGLARELPEEADAEGDEPDVPATTKRRKG